jgi:hypothetical protein
MSNQQYFAIKAIKENKTGATAAQLAKYGIKNASAVIASLRKRGHTIITQFSEKNGQRVGKYVMPFGTRTEEEKLSKTAHKQISKQFDLAT